MPAPTHTYPITHKQLVDNFAVIQSLENVEVAVGESVTIGSVGAPFNGTFNVYSVSPYLLVNVDSEGDLVFDYDVVHEHQIIFKCTGTDVPRQAATGTITYAPHCTWVDDQDVLDWLGIDPATQNDSDFVTLCTDAANAWAWNRRREAGYSDSLTVTPSQSVFLGTIMYAATLYRERGSVDGYSSFTELGSSLPMLTLGRIYQLLGVNRSQVA